jgi:uridine kinase
VKGEVPVIQESHRRVARELVPQILGPIRRKAGRYTITIAGESGSGKTATGRALADELMKHGLPSVVLGQDDYFVLPPRSNDAERRSNPQWLGPHVEVRLDRMDQNLAAAIQGMSEITKPLVDYESNSIEEETIPLVGVRVVIAEGTYTSLLKHVDTRIFIDRTWLDTMEDRRTRNRGAETGDPFIERVLSMEHKIIAGHKQLADFVITRDYALIPVPVQDA